MVTVSHRTVCSHRTLCSHCTVCAASTPCWVDGVTELAGGNEFIACSTAACSPNSSLGHLGGGTSLYADQAWLDATLAPESRSILLISTGLLGIGAIGR